MEVAASLTIWGMFSCYLLFHVMRLPALLPRTAMTILVAELVALGIWHYGSEGCVERPCGALAETGRVAAALDIPLLAALFVVVATIRGLIADRRARRQLSSRPPSRAAAPAAPAQRHTPRPRRASRPPAAPR